MIHLHLEAEGLDEAAARAAVSALQAARRMLGVPDEAEMALVLTGDALLRELNERYRGQAKATDVLSFAVDPEDLPPGEPAQLGDVIISVPQARANAERAGHAMADELRLLAVHGLLHLLGWDDETDEGAEAMRAEEVRLGVRPPDEA